MPCCDFTLPAFASFHSQPQSECGTWVSVKPLTLIAPQQRDQLANNQVPLRQHAIQIARIAWRHSTPDTWRVEVFRFSMKFLETKPERTEQLFRSSHDGVRRRTRGPWCPQLRGCQRWGEGRYQGVSPVAGDASHHEASRVSGASHAPVQALLCGAGKREVEGQFEWMRLGGTGNSWCPCWSA